MKQKLKICGLSKNAQLFLKSIQNGQGNTINGNTLWKAIHNFENSSMISQSIIELNKLIQNKTKQFQPQLNKFCSQIQKEISQFYQFLQKQIQKRQKNNLSQFTKTKYVSNVLQIFNNSNVITSKQQEQTIKSFFGKRSIKAAKLLYKASENNFEVQKFHSTCDNIPNTLTLCETQFNKKIGGYTPLAWKSKQSQWQIDRQQQSFIFSLTHKDKLRLTSVNSQYSIFNNKQYGPAFGGGHDLYINRSYIQPQHTYINNNYQYATAESYERFSGALNNSPVFKTKQWEVWAIQFN